MVIFYDLSTAQAQTRNLRKITRIRFRLLDLVILEEVYQVALMRLKGLLGSKLMHTKLLDDFKDVNLFVKLALGVLKKIIVPFFFGL